MAIATLAWASFAESDTIYLYTGDALQLKSQTNVPAVQPKERTIKEAISWYSDQYGYNMKILSGLALCESTYRDICIIDTNGLLSCGAFQFQKATFEQNCPDLKWNSSVESDIKCAGKMIKEGGNAVLKAHWTTCSKKLLK